MAGSNDEMSAWRLPVAWVAFLMLQTGGGFFWAASMQGRIDSIERYGSSVASTALAEVRNVGGRLSVVEATIAQIPINGNRITRIEAQIENLKMEIDRLEQMLDKSPQGPVGPIKTPQ